MQRHEFVQLTPAAIDGYPDGHDNVLIDAFVRPEQRGRRLLDLGIDMYVRHDVDIGEWTAFAVSEEWPWWKMLWTSWSKEECRVRLAAESRFLGNLLDSKTSFGSVFEFYRVGKENI